jgi:type II secretory pathway pseudopilin PulG
MRSGKARQAGFTYLAALMLVALLGGGLATYGEAWSSARQREREAELAWIGSQFRDAIGLYYHRTPGAAKKYPGTLEDLLEDRRFLARQRYLRRIYTDPMTGRAEWGVVTAAEGGIRGVYSLAAGAPRTKPALASYRDWTFVYEPPITAGAARSPG